MPFFCTYCVHMWVLQCPFFTILHLVTFQIEFIYLFIFAKIQLCTVLISVGISEHVYMHNNFPVMTQQVYPITTEHEA